MSKKVMAIAMAVIMTLSIFSILAMSVPAVKAQGDIEVFLRPGIPDPYKPGFSHTLGTLAYTPELILDNHAYLEYAIITDTVGDLQFDLGVNVPLGYIEITYPCDFTFTRGEGEDADIVFSVWTDITNDYGYITSTLDDCLIKIGEHDGLGENFVIEPGLYHVRLFSVRAPSAFGVYYFKIATDLEEDGIPVEDWPIIVVKGELNPAYITGVVSADTGLTDGIVTAKGTTPDGRAVEGFFDFTPDEHDIFECPNAGCPDGEPGDYAYWLIGAPAGDYEVTASSIDDGYAPSSSSRFSVSAAQSFHLPDISISKGPDVYITVWSKHGRGTIPWGCLWQPSWDDDLGVAIGTNDPTVDPTMCGDSIRQITLYIYDEAGEEVTSDTFDLDPTANFFTEHLTALEAGKTYTIKAYVTGYVMTEDDAWQRTFTVSTGSDVASVEMDLRRSNWFELAAHSFEPLNDMTVVYTATDSAGEVKGLVAYELPGGFDDPWFNIILEGFARADEWDDYGLEPGTYEIKLYAADGTPPDPAVLGAVEGVGWYYINAGEPTMGTIALCYSPSFISFEVSAIKLKLVLRSVDWQCPAHPRPWTFPGAEIWVDFVDVATDEVVASLDPTTWVLVQDDGNIGSPHDVDFEHDIGEHSLLGIVWTGDNVSVEDALDGTGPDDWPTSLSPGQYNFQIHTYGYVERRVFPVWVPDSGLGDIQADLIQGGMVRVEVSFTKEDQDIPFNGFVRVELYDQDGNLAGANIYGQAVPNFWTTIDGYGSYPVYDWELDWKLVPEAAEGANIDDADGDVYFDGQRAYTSSKFYGIPAMTWANWPMMDPSDANRLALPEGESEAFDVYGFYWYYGGPSSRNEGLWANGWETTDGEKHDDSGIRGSRDGCGDLTGAGLYTVKVFAFDPLGADGEWMTADDWASYYGDPVEGVEIPWGGSQSVSVSLAEMGRLSGTINWIDMYGNERYLPQAMLSATCSPEASLTHTITPQPALDYEYTEPGYFMWLPAGTCDVSVAVDGASQVFGSMSFSVAMADGFRASADQVMTPTGVPVPEFPATLLVLLSALSASVYLLRRRRIAKK